MHLATALFDRDDLDESTLDERLRGYLNAWIRFRSETGFKPELVEQKFHHPKLNYAGTPDRTGWIEGQYGVLDLKKMLTVPHWVGVQTAAGV